MSLAQAAGGRDAGRMSVLHLAFLVVLSACWASAPRHASAGSLLSGKVVAVHDGDTITVLDAGRRQHRIRLYQIDAPERGQDYGASSKRSLSQLVYGRQVSVDWVTTDRYQRKVGTIYLSGTDINLQQVRRGMAWVYRSYAHDPAYLSAEQSARARRIGLWARTNPVPPWEFRREHGNHHDSAGRGWFKRFW